MEQVRAAGWKAGVPAENVRLVVTDEMYAILFDAFDALACEIYNVMHDGCFAIAYVPETLGGAS
ncbi:hypothetical protein [Roseimicrobium sp. ORNL1]|uniref:hypothetical protein n=1 Tax=Roseimicrobium sp. ORNL1 TaxID=2711231 RepID=UPI0013E10C99|nr:hypothetical protein [Roseimicrobium sp. ORNL1]QIF03716.1 hypothetical protein G5S37_20055 [Roseimicrobium sp. ORNL1]